MAFYLQDEGASKPLLFININCSSFGESCTQNFSKRLDINVIPGQKIMVAAKAMSSAYTTDGFPPYRESSIMANFTYTVRVIEKGCQGLKVEAFSDVLPTNSGIAGDTSTTITASVSSPAPAGGCEVTFEQPKPVAYSGGHQHDDAQRPHGSLDKTTCTIQEGITFCTVKYTSSEISGEEKIKAKLTSTGEETEGIVKVKVSGLLPLESKPNLLPRGQTDKHTVGNNNYGTTYTRDAVYYAVSEYAKEYGIEPDIYLAVIDMSLPWGGLFDIDGNWKPPHDYHRIGRSVDFSKHYKDGNGNDLEVTFFDEDGNVAEVTEIVDDDKLDEFFEDENFECTRKEKDKGLIHYQCPK